MKKCSLPTLLGWFLSSDFSIENKLMAKGIAKWLNEKEDYPDMGGRASEDGLKMFIL